MTPFTDAMITAMLVSLADRKADRMWIPSLAWDSLSPALRAEAKADLREALDAAARAEVSPSTEVAVDAETDGSGASVDIAVTTRF